MRTLKPAGKLEQLTHAMSRYHWNIVGLCEMRWKNFGEMLTDDGHKVYFSGEEGKHEYGVGFLVHKDVVGAVLECQPVSSRLISIRLRAAPFNITIIQVYAPTSGHDDSEVDHLYQKLQETIDQAPKKDILVVDHSKRENYHFLTNTPGKFYLYFILCQLRTTVSMRRSY